MTRDSYSIYLWHIVARNLLLATLAEAGLGWSPVVIACTYVLVAIAPGMGMARAIERPVLAARDRMFSDYQSRARSTDGYRSIRYASTPRRSAKLRARL
jgi:peptidoglycan/LPS O-acetylase OafA/YrhL